MKKNDFFYMCSDICEILNVSNSCAYKIIRNLNKELEEQGYYTQAGRVPKKFFQERYGLV